MDFTGKIAFVTGGSGGIGLSICEEMAKAGAKVILGYSRKDISSVQKEFASKSIPMEYQRIDVSNPDSVRDAASAIEKAHGPVDYLVTAAGVAQTHGALEYTDDEWRKTQAINLDGTFFCAREFAGQMIPKKKGAMVFISSIAAFRAVRPEFHASYGSSKAAVSHLAKLMANELTQYGIRVNAVAPGYVNTDILKNVGSTSPETMEMWLGQNPMKRLIEPVEIANTVMFMLSDLASAVNGANLMADCGYTIW